MSAHWSGVGVGGYVEEEGELVESGGETSDDDYSPGSLVIDAKDEGTIGTIIHQSIYTFVYTVYMYIVHQCLCGCKIHVHVVHVYYAYAILELGELA